MPAIPKPSPKPKKKRLSMAQRRKQRIGETATEAEVAALFNQYGHRCLGCGNIVGTLTVDHVVPVSKGGSSLIDNLQPLCFKCNLNKGTNVVDFRPLWTDPFSPPTHAELEMLWHRRSSTGLSAL